MHFVHIAFSIFVFLNYLCIMANRSSVVRSLLGEGNKLSSSHLESSVRGEFELSLGVESAKNSLYVMLNTIHRT